MAPSGRPTVLLGRHAERALLDRWKNAVRSGRGGALVVRGEPGIGKSALLEHAVATAGGFQVVQGDGVEAETDLPFAVLQQVCSPLLSALERLPAPQQDALAVTFGLRSGAPPEPLMLGLPSSDCCRGRRPADRSSA
ncbi:ATP-binding protein [Streptomyces sp. NPDC046977]|uniref:ATP-binding protein n=1 Tax=Streptomyces sp. NPDC046977 TaxID=3154703 RepID=UPI0033DA287C